MNFVEAEMTRFTNLINKQYKRRCILSSLVIKQSNSNKFVEFLFLALAIALPLSGALTTLLWMLLLVITLFKFFRKPDYSIFKDKIHLPVYIFTLISLVSIFFAVNFNESLIELKKTAEVLIMFMFIYNMKDDIELNKKFVKYIFIGISIAAMFGLVQFFLGINIAYGNTIIPPYLKDVPFKFIKFLALNDGRIEGTQSLYLTYAEILLSCLAFFIPVYSYKVFHKDKNRKNYGYVYLFFILCILLAISFSFCRAVWIGTICSFLFLFFLDKSFRKVFFILLFFTSILIYIVNDLHPNRRSLIDRFDAIKISSNMDRIRMWQSGLEIIKAYPIFGVGPRCMKIVYNNYLMPDAGKNGEHEFNLGHVHNNYVQIAADRGMIGLFFFLLMFLVYFVFFYAHFRKNNCLYTKYIAIGGCCFVLAFLIFGTTEYCFGDNEVAMVFWAILGTAIAAIYNYKNANKDIKMRKLKNILVTGGAGFIGTNFIKYTFETEKFDGKIVNLDKLTYAGNKENLNDVERNFENRYFFELGDINDREKVAAILKKYDIDTIIHFAAESHVDRSIAEPEEFVKTNILGTFVLLDCAQKYWGDRQDVLFHHISTDEVYGSLGEYGYFYETTNYDPHSPYSASKAGSDHLVSAFHHTYNLPITLSNCSNNYGPYQHKEKMIPLMIHNILNGLKLPVYGDGKNVRDWLFVDDHSSAIWCVLKKGSTGEKYNIGGENEWTNIKLVKFLCKKTAKMAGQKENPYKKLVSFVKDRRGHDKRYAINCDKLKNLDWKRKYNFEDGIEKTIKWYIENN